VLFGLAPALHTVRGHLKESLSDGSRGGTASRGRKRLRNAFVVGQIAIALGLLTGAVELRGVMNGLVFADNGFRADGLLTFQMTLPDRKYTGAAERLAFEEEVIRLLEATPGVEDVAVMASLPRGRENVNSFFQIEGREVDDLNQRPRTNWQSVNPQYFSTLEIPQISGRPLEIGDREEAPPVIVVNQEFASRFFPEGEALGRRIEIQGAYREIVGIVGNIMQSRIPFDGFVEPSVYVPLAQLPLRSPAFAIRVSGPATALGSDVRSAVSSVDPDQPITLLRTMEKHIEYEVAAMSFLARFVSGLCVLALFLSAIGIYGVMSHSVLQERKELGIRLAVGARESQLVGMVTRKGLVLAAVGMLLGTPLALWAHREVMSALSLIDAEIGYGLAMTAMGALAGVALLASFLPARSAARVQATQALTME